MIKLMNLTMPYTYTEQELYVASGKALKNSYSDSRTDHISEKIN